MTMYNNPAFHLFLAATLEPYKLQWPTGEDNLLLISIGTGTSARAADSSKSPATSGDVAAASFLLLRRSPRIRRSPCGN